MDASNDETLGEMMQSLLQAMKERFSEWPEGKTYFTCDPDGEVRGYPTIDADFYPKNSVHESERASDFGTDDGAVVTKELFESI